jgi:3-(3-hydroxy-phenyl)propionate hydroxylase
MVPGAAMDDAPMQESGNNFWLLDRVGKQFMALVLVIDPSQVDAATARVYKSLADAAIPIEVVLVSPKAGVAPEGLRVFVDEKHRFTERFDAQSGTTYLIRPDQHVAARWRNFDALAVKAALARATSNVH